MPLKDLDVQYDSLYMYVVSKWNEKTLYFYPFILKKWGYL